MIALLGLIHGVIEPRSSRSRSSSGSLVTSELIGAGSHIARVRDTEDGLVDVTPREQQEWLGLGDVREREPD